VVNRPTVPYSILILQGKMIEHILLCFVCMFSINLTLEYAFIYRSNNFKNCTLFILCIFLQAIHPPTNALNRTQFTKIIKILKKCHS
jgi:hypothetical protein